MPKAVNILRIVAYAWMLFFAIQFIAHPPFWSRMDDASNLQKHAHNWKSASLSEVVKAETAFEVSGIGMYRPVYIIFAYYFYDWFYTQPAWAYTFLLIFILSLFWLAGGIFEKMLDPSKEKGLKYLFFILACAFTPHTNLYLHASILEKFLVVTGVISLIALQWFTNEKTQKNTVTISVFLVTIILGFALGFLSKPNVIFIMGPVLTWLIIEALQKKKWTYLAVAGVLVAIVIPTGLYFLSIRGAYSNRYSLGSFGSFLANLEKRQILYASLAVSAILVSVGVNFLKSRNWMASLNPRELVWPIGLLSFIVVMIPWNGGTSAYYITPAGIFIVGSLSVIIFKLWVERPSKYKWMYVALPIFLTFVAVSPVRSRIITQAGQRNVASWIEEKFKNQEEDTIFVMPMPCREASLSLAYFSGYSGKILMAHRDRFPEEAVGKKVYMVTLKDCPPRPIEGFKFGDVVYSMGEWVIYDSGNG